MMARYGVLKCGNNYKGTMREICDTCDQIDDEGHRINNCCKWREVNLFESSEKLNFEGIYSNDLVEIRRVTNVIEKIWDTQNANGTMRTN